MFATLQDVVWLHHITCSHHGLQCLWSVIFKTQSNLYNTWIQLILNAPVKLRKAATISFYKVGPSRIYHKKKDIVAKLCITEANTYKNYIKLLSHVNCYWATTYYSILWVLHLCFFIFSSFGEFFFAQHTSGMMLIKKYLVDEQLLFYDNIKVEWSNVLLIHIWPM